MDEREAFERIEVQVRVFTGYVAARSIPKGILV